MESKITIELKAKYKMDSTIIFGFVTFLPCLVHLSLVRIRITITTLYSIILPILIPSYSANDFCASDRWSFGESTLLKVKAYVVCICDSMKKEITIIVNTSNGVQFSA
jgi:hypothetical protein